MNLKKLGKNKKGFTLVEIIVVLIIIAILAAAAIPSMIKYIDDARGKAAIAEARSIYVAAEYHVNKALGEGAAATSVASFTGTQGSLANNATAVANLPGNVVAYAGLKTETYSFNVRIDTTTHMITSIEYFNGTFLVTLIVSGTGAGTVTSVPATALPAL